MLDEFITSLLNVDTYENWMKQAYDEGKVEVQAAAEGKEVSKA